MSPATEMPSARWRQAITRVWTDDRWLLLALFVLFVAVRWPLRSQFLVNWDAVNFALGVEGFDLVHHQPHPPGYLGYILLGRVATALFGDANAGLVALSVVAGAALPVGSYLLARRMLERQWAMLLALLIGTSPVVWYYSVVALTYVVSGAIVVFLVWAAHVARHEGSRGHLYAAAVLTALLGALRQTDLLFMLPVLVYAMKPFPWRERNRAAGLLAGVALLWAVPLLWLAGGPFEYLRLSRELAELAGGRTWILGLNPVGVVQNLGLVAIGVLLGLNVALLALPIAASRRVNLAGVLDGEDWQLLRLWVFPALAVFVFVHTGQIGYVLLILPAAFLVVIGAAQAAVRVRERRRPVPRTLAALGGATVGRPVLAGLVLLNATGFFAYPATARGIIVEQQSSDVGEVVANTFVEDDGTVIDRTRQYDVRANDEYWASLTETVDSYDPDEAVVLAVPVSGGAFRHLAYYLPEQCVYAVGRDRQGRLGHLFTATAGTSDYEVEGLSSSNRMLPLPSGVTTLLVPDQELRSAFANAGIRPDEIVGDAELAVYRVPDGAILAFGQSEEQERHRIEVRERLAGPAPEGCITGD